MRGAIIGALLSPFVASYAVKQMGCPAGGGTGEAFAVFLLVIIGIINCCYDGAVSFIIHFIGYGCSCWMMWDVGAAGACRPLAMEWPNRHSCCGVISVGASIGQAVYVLITRDSPCGNSRADLLPR